MRKISQFAIMAAVGCSSLTAGSAWGQVEPGFTKVYEINLAASQNYNTTAPVYSTDNHSSVASGSFDRVAYLLTLSGSTSASSPNGYLYVSFDTPTTDAGKIGIPYRATGASFQQSVTNLNVSSNVTGVTSGTGLNNGRIEFWPDDYSEGANGVYDYNDDHTPGGNYGSMQVFSGTNTLFGYNDWGSDGGVGDLGIGNNTTAATAFNPGETNPDWTFRDNINDYTSRNLQIFVHAVPEPASLSLIALGATLVLRRRR